MTEQEQAAWQAYWAAPSVATRNALLMHYQPWLYHEAHKMRGTLPPGCILDVDDLASVATIALAGAITRYDPQLHVSFRAFSWSAVRGAMVDELRSLDFVPRSARTKERKGLATPVEMRRASSLDDQAEYMGKATEGGQQVIDDLDELRAALRGFSSGERKLLFLRFVDGLCYRAIGEVTGRTRCRAFQIFHTMQAEGRLACTERR